MHDLVLIQLYYYFIKIECNGMEWNGMEWNWIELNGNWMKWNECVLPPPPPKELLSLRSPQHPLLWDECSDGCWSGPGGDYPAGPGDEKDGAQHIRRLWLWTQRQPGRQPRNPRGSCEEEVRLLIIDLEQLSDTVLIGLD